MVREGEAIEERLGTEELYLSTLRYFHWQVLLIYFLGI